MKINKLSLNARKRNLGKIKLLGSTVIIVTSYKNTSFLCPAYFRERKEPHIE